MKSYDEWLAEHAAARPFGERDRLGTANYIDAAARQRGAGSIVTGESVALARPIVPGPSPRGDDKPGFHVEVFYTDGPIGMGSDHVEFDCHGRTNTHLDSLNHIAIGGRWYCDWAVDDPDGPSVAHLAEHELFTRGVVVDVPALRRTDWVDAADPVEGADIEASLRLSGVRFEAGDALLLYMGRDRYEAAGASFSGLAEGHVMPGVGRTAAEWIADNHVSMLCWDFLDSNHPSQPFVCVHRLIWAIGLLLVDNCHLAPAAQAARTNGRVTGGVVVAPLAIPGGTGCSVRPLWIL